MVGKRGGFKNIFKKDVLSWALYDFANSSYSLLIISFIFPIYFKEIIAGAQYGDFYWGLISSISVLLAGIVSPVIGAAADYDYRKKRKFILCVILSAIATFLLFFSKSGTLIFASLVFIASNLFFLLASSLYDSFLAHVSSKKNAGTVSGLGYGLGYLGGIIAMLLLKPLYTNGYSGEFEALYKLVFPLTALFFILFSLPSFYYLKEKRIASKNPKKESFVNLTKIGFRDTFKNLKELRKNKPLAWFLVAFYFMNDALVTIFAFISLYAIQTLSLSVSEVTIVFLIVQVVGIPSAFLLGWLADKKGQRRILLASIALWILIVFLLSFGSSKFMMYLVAVLTGLVIGGSQSIARSWFSNIVPRKKRFGLFGFNSFASKISATVGPVLFGAISSFSGNQRIAMLSLAPFFIISFIIFSRIKQE
ncbi:MFS transporter [Candidatus Pacearchaeota archaeon]|nr:MFS transporter [Candidatus Pacearchaeota archaeon]